MFFEFLISDERLFYLNPEILMRHYWTNNLWLIICASRNMRWSNTLSMKTTFIIKTGFVLQNGCNFIQHVNDNLIRRLNSNPVRRSPRSTVWHWRVIQEASQMIISPTHKCWWNNPLYYYFGWELILRCLNMSSYHVTHAKANRCQDERSKSRRIQKASVFTKPIIQISQGWSCVIVVISQSQHPIK